MRGRVSIRQILAWLTVALAGAAVAGGLVPAACAQTLSASDKAIYRQAFKAVDQEHWVDARRLASRARNPLPAKMIQWLDLIRPGPGRSFDEISQFMRENPDWPYQLRLQAMAERNMPQGMAPDTVFAWFKGRTPQTAYGAAVLARAMLGRGQAQPAADLVRSAWRDDNFDNELDEGAFLVEFGRLLRPEDHLARLDRLLWNHDEPAARQLMPLVDPGHRAVAEARLALADHASTVATAVGSVPAALQHDAGLLYELARSRLRNDDYSGAAAVLDPPPTSVGQPGVMWRVLDETAREAVWHGDKAGAYRIAAAHGASQGSTFADGEWLAGWIALRFLGNAKLGYEHFTELYAGVSTPISKARGAYWAARAAERMGDAKTAENWYRAAASNMTTYYGQLAAARIGRADALHFASMPQPTKADRVGFDKRELVRLVRLLGQLDQAERARPFLQEMADDATAAVTLRMVADLGRDMNRLDLALMVAHTARSKGVDLPDYLYPLRTVPLGGGPEPSLALAVIRQESAFETKAVSSAGALGLMQLMPPTAKGVAKALKVRFRKEQLTRDGDYNVKLGRAYLDELLNGYDQSYILAIAAYNAGPDRVNEWIRTYGDPRSHGIDAIDWIELIPWSETRNYVQRVLENLQVYRHRLGTTLIAQSLQQDLLRGASQ
jgi:soluble lytic murein transglycosylase